MYAFFQLIILCPHPHFTRLKSRRSADPHFTGGRQDKPFTPLDPPSVYTVVYQVDLPNFVHNVTSNTMETKPAPTNIYLILHFRPLQHHTNTQIQNGRQLPERRVAIYRHALLQRNARTKVALRSRT